MADLTYGTSIRDRKSGRLIDVDLADSREEAEETVARQNEKIRSWDVGVEWVLVEIRAVEAE